MGGASAAEGVSSIRDWKIRKRRREMLLCDKGYDTGLPPRWTPGDDAMTKTLLAAMSGFAAAAAAAWLSAPHFARFLTPAGVKVVAVAASEPAGALAAFCLAAGLLGGLLGLCARLGRRAFALALVLAALAFSAGVLARRSRMSRATRFFRDDGVSLACRWPELGMHLAPLWASAAAGAVACAAGAVKAAFGRDMQAKP